MRARAGSAALVVALLAGCQASGPESVKTPVSTPAAPRSSPSNPSRSPAAPTPSPQYLMPLALVVHATRPTANVTVTDARRVVASGAVSCRPLANRAVG